jgi:hypothetical protein
MDKDQGQLNDVSAANPDIVKQINGANYVNAAFVCCKNQSRSVKTGSGQTQAMLTGKFLKTSCCFYIRPHGGAVQPFTRPSDAPPQRRRWRWGRRAHSQARSAPGKVALCGQGSVHVWSLVGWSEQSVLDGGRPRWFERAARSEHRREPLLRVGHGQRDDSRRGCGKRSFFECFPYVCPEPVLAK